MQNYRWATMILLFSFNFKTNTAYPTKMERELTATQNYKSNTLPFILPYSFSTIFHSVNPIGKRPDDILVGWMYWYEKRSRLVVLEESKFIEIETMENILSNYFTSDLVQKTIIYDVRLQQNSILFDISIGIDQQFKY